VERCLACEAEEGSTRFRPIGLASEAALHMATSRGSNFDQGGRFSTDFFWYRKKFPGVTVYGVNRWFRDLDPVSEILALAR
jgi:hypothetical protein